MIFRDRAEKHAERIFDMDLFQDGREPTSLYRTMEKLLSDDDKPNTWQENYKLLVISILNPGDDQNESMGKTMHLITLAFNFLSVHASDPCLNQYFLRDMDTTEKNIGVPVADWHTKYMIAIGHFKILQDQLKRNIPFTIQRNDDGPEKYPQMNCLHTLIQVVCHFVKHLRYNYLGNDKNCTLRDVDSPLTDASLWSFCKRSVQAVGCLYIRSFLLRHTNVIPLANIKMDAKHIAHYHRLGGPSQGADRQEEKEIDRKMSPNKKRTLRPVETTQQRQRRLSRDSIPPAKRHLTHEGWRQELFSIATPQDLENPKLTEQLLARFMDATNELIKRYRKAAKVHGNKADKRIPEGQLIEDCVLCTAPFTNETSKRRPYVQFMEHIASRACLVRSVKGGRKFIQEVEKKYNLEVAQCGRVRSVRYRQKQKHSVLSAQCSDII